jgi:hypothetical protein
MVSAELPARVSWPDETHMEGRVTLDYLADVDPWLVHMVFQVAQVREDVDVERMTLIQGAATIVTGPQWMSFAGAPFRIGCAGSYTRFRLTDTDTGSWCDFDVNTLGLRQYLAKTEAKCSQEAERAALSAYIETGLGDLTHE